MLQLKTDRLTLGLLAALATVAPSDAIAGTQANPHRETWRAGRERTFVGTVERVWEDGFRLETGERRVRVDSWDVCGDFTHRNLAVGDRVTVTGEFEGREFDAFDIVKDDGSEAGSAICR